MPTFLLLLLLLMMFCCSYMDCACVDCSEFICLLLAWISKHSSFIYVTVLIRLSVFYVCAFWLWSVCHIKYIYITISFIRFVNRLEQSMLYIFLLFLIYLRFFLFLHSFQYTNFYDNDCNKSSYMNVTRHF